MRSKDSRFLGSVIIVAVVTRRAIGLSLSGHVAHSRAYSSYIPQYLWMASDSTRHYLRSGLSGFS